MIKYSFFKVSTMFCHRNGTMERDFLPRAKTWKTVRQTRNQDAAHAHKHVTASLSWATRRHFLCAHITNPHNIFQTKIQFSTKSSMSCLFKRKSAELSQTKTKKSKLLMNQWIPAAPCHTANSESIYKLSPFETRAAFGSFYMVHIIIKMPVFKNI